jgi:hypothetical protein
MFTDVSIGLPELFASRYWVECWYRVDGMLKVKLLSGETQHEATRQAEAFAQELQRQEAA